MGIIRAWASPRRLVVTAVLLCALAAMATVAIYTYTAYQDAASDLIVERDRQLVYLTAARFREEIVTISDNLAAVALKVDGITQNQAWHKSVLLQMRDRLVHFDGGVIILNDAGTVQSAEPERPEIIGADWSQRFFFHQLTSSTRVYVADAAPDGPNGAEVVALSVPIIGSNGEFNGAVVGLLLVGSASTDDLFASMVRLGLGENGDAHLIDGNRKVLYDSAHRDVDNPLRMTGLPIGTTSALGAQRTRDEDGRDIVAAHAAIPGTSWSLMVVDDWATLSWTTRRYANRLLGLLALGITVAPITVALLVHDQQREVRQHELSEQETRVAGLIQNMMLPRQPPTVPGWDLAIRHTAAPSGRRAFHDFLFRPDGNLALTIGEVSDRGLPAAHIISTVRATLRGAAHRQLPPQEALECSNTLLCPEMTDGMSLHCLFAVISAQTGRVHYASAGVSAPHRDGAEVQSGAPAAGAPLGQALESRYVEHTLLLAPGERLLLHSSGVLACRNPQGEAFGAGRLDALLRRQQGTAQQTVDALVGAIEAFVDKKQGLHDDFVVAVLQRQNGQSTGPVASE